MNGVACSSASRLSASNATRSKTKILLAEEYENQVGTKILLAEESKDQVGATAQGRMTSKHVRLNPSEAGARQEDEEQPAAAHYKSSTRQKAIQLW